MIYVVRHGYSAATENPVIFGQMDPKEVPLTVFGYKQSEFSGKIIANNIIATPKPVIVYYSPYKRIIQSTHGVLSGFNQKLDNNYNHPIMRIMAHEGIIERDHGGFDGKSPEV